MYDTWTDGEVSEVLVPYSPAARQTAEEWFRLHSDWLQNIVALEHSPYEIRLILEWARPLTAADMPRLDAGQLRQLAGRLVRLQPILRRLRLEPAGLRPVLRGDGTPAFAPLLPGMPTAGPWRRFLPQACPPADGGRSFLYRCDGICSGVLQRFPLDLTPTAVNVKIRISAPATLRPAVFNRLARQWQSADVLLLRIPAGRACRPLLAAALGAPQLGDDTTALFEAWRLFLARSPFRHLVLLTEGPLARRDAEFLKYTVDMAGLSGVLLMVCGEEPLLDYDLLLRESAVNLLADEQEPTEAEDLSPRNAAADSVAVEAEPEADPAAAVWREAHELHRQRDYRRLAQVLSGMVDRPQEREDEFHYLSFLCGEKSGNAAVAEQSLARIVSPYYRNLAAVQWSNRLVYQGRTTAAEEQVREVVDFFERGGHVAEEIEAGCQLAKIWREMGRRDAAEESYKNLFVRSEIAGSRLLSGYIAVDLANLYLLAGDDRRAESWYGKALRRFEELHHRHGVMLATSNLIDIRLKEGEWPECESLLETVQTFDEERGNLSSVAVDRFNRAFLHFRRADFPRARAELTGAMELFTRLELPGGEAECALLQARIDYAEGRIPHLPERVHGHLSAGQCASLRILESNDATGAATALAELRDAPPDARFETLAQLALRWTAVEFLPPLRELSALLSQPNRNYYFYEYWFIHFVLSGLPAAGDEEAERLFRETMDFFRRNGRRPTPVLRRLESEWRERRQAGEMFDHARLVGDAVHWKVPDDFFRALCRELNPDGRYALLRLQVFEEGETVFDFSASPHFAELGAEILQRARHSGRALSLTVEEVKALFASTEKAFYFFPRTHVLLWPLGPGLVGVLLLARKEPGALPPPVEAHRETLNRFAALFHRYYENDFRVREKLKFLIGDSAAMQVLKRRVARVARVDFAVLITGPSGSGKELVAQAVHLLSHRVRAPFVPVNAAAIPESLLEAELFGFRKGAFTGAQENRIGLIVEADKGTLFLDEIADLPLPLQAKLLRVLQESEVRRLGENKTVRVDVRLISATNKDIPALIREGKFREDLYFRLQDLTLEVPPLAQRREDIPLLVRSFLEQHRFHDADPERLECFLQELAREPWPGNVRELAARVKRWITFYGDDGPPIPATPPTLREARERFECDFLQRVLRECGWRRAEAARRLGITRMALFNLLKKHGLAEE